MNDSPLSVSIQQDVTVLVAHEPTFAIREKDWARIYKRVDALQRQQREFSAVAWASVGAALSAVLTGFTWAPAYRALSEADKLEFSWVSPAIIAFGLLGLFLGAGMFWAAHTTRQAEKATAKIIIEDMRDIHPVSTSEFDTDGSILITR